MCSSVLGPAMPPPLVTWPTTNTAVPLSLANRMSRAAHSRTCPTLPGAPSRSPVNTVWIESTTSTRGRLVRRPWRGSVSRLVSASSGTSAAALAQPVGAQLHLQRRLLARDVERAHVRRLRSRAATCSRSVDLPMPGSPPTSTIEPGTRPPPSTKSNSSRPVGQRRRLRALHVAQARRGRDAAAARPAAAAPRARRCGCGGARLAADRSPRPGCSTRRTSRSGRPTWGARRRTRCSDRPFWPWDSRGPAGALPCSSRTACTCLWKNRFTMPVGPLRCLPTMISGVPSSELPSLSVGTVVELLTVDEHDEVGVLLDGTRFAQIGQLRALVLAGALLGRARELRERDHRHARAPWPAP